MLVRLLDVYDYPGEEQDMWHLTTMLRTLC